MNKYKIFNYHRKYVFHIYVYLYRDICITFCMIIVEYIICIVIIFLNNVKNILSNY